MKISRYQIRFPLLALSLILAIFLADCSGVTVTESIMASPTVFATIGITLSATAPSIDIDMEISSILLRYGWTVKEQIFTDTITLPNSLQHSPGDFPYAIYWAYNNEFNKAIGLDLVPFLGQPVQVSMYLLNEQLPKEFYPITTAYAVIVVHENKIVGAWIDKGRHYGFAASLDKKSFNEIVKEDWSQWLVSAGVVDMSNNIDRELSTKTPEEIIEIYYTALNDHDIHMMNAVRSRRNLTSDLFVNKDPLALINFQDDSTITIWVDNIKSARLLNIESINNPNNCLPVYGALVNFQFTNPKLPTIPEGSNLRFMVLNEEIKGLGWRIEEINTAPGVSERLCLP